ncbi:hypothetical protein Pla22_01220 [Rubripirellula amarantea]|uniref:Uncharacterized protein n=1 Tax=Rubripirellula amarantea TaxID=2527999 RepID=A0A5C5WPB8_9BACT|nr:hypothetical protein Pla22_01220 [Rubripirellula amarantea]
MSEQTIGRLDATLFTRAASVVRNRGYFLDQLHIQTSGLQRSDSTLAARTWALNLHFNITHAEFLSLFSSLLCSTLTGERGALTTTLEPARSSTGPAKRIALGISDGHGRVIERCVNVSNAAGDVATDAFLFVGLCHGKVLCKFVG